MNTISFMSANFIARELGYRMTGGWSQGHKAMTEHFRPLETYEERLDALLQEVVDMGYRAIDFYVGHLDPVNWASAEHVAIALGLLQKHSLSVNSLAGGFGGTREELEKSCDLARTLGTTVLGGGSALFAKDRSAAVKILRERGVRLGLENHPEKTPAELLQRMGKGDEDVVGAALDTGWFGTQGYDAAKATEELMDRIFIVHLKDIREPTKEGGEGTLKSIGHETCALGDGVVPVERCVAVLKKGGYGGPISFEHEPEDLDPTKDAVISLKRLKGWLG